MPQIGVDSWHLVSCLGAVPPATVLLVLIVDNSLSVEAALVISEGSNKALDLVKALVVIAEQDSR